MKPMNRSLLLWLFGVLVASSLHAQESDSLASLCVNMHAFNYSDGVNSDEEREYCRRQGSELGQPHFTFENAGECTYYVYLFPETDSFRKKVENSLAETEQLMKQGWMPKGEPCNDLLQGSLGDQRLALRSGYLAVFELLPAKNILPDLPPGEYLVLPGVRFHRQGFFSSSYLYTPYYFDDTVSFVSRGFSGDEPEHVVTFTPVVWGPKRVTLRAGGTSYLDFAPHPFNMESDGYHFIHKIVLREQW